MAEPENSRPSLQLVREYSNMEMMSPQVLATPGGLDVTTFPWQRKDTHAQHTTFCNRHP